MRTDFLFIVSAETSTALSMFFIGTYLSLSFKLALVLNFGAPGGFQCGNGPAHPPRVSVLQQAARLWPLFQSTSPRLAVAIHRSSGCPGPRPSLQPRASPS